VLGWLVRSQINLILTFGRDGFLPLVSAQITCTAGFRKPKQLVGPSVKGRDGYRIFNLKPVDLFLTFNLRALHGQQGLDPLLRRKVKVKVKLCMRSPKMVPPGGPIFRSVFRFIFEVFCIRVAEAQSFDFNETLWRSKLFCG
jgi:hypothetical protein